MSKFYAVAKGYVPGIYETWDEAKKQVNGFPEAKHKKFSTYEEAVFFMSEYAPDVILEKKVINNIKNNKKSFENAGAIAYVDGSYDEKTNKYSYGVVFIIETNGIKNEIQLSGNGDDQMLVDMRNVAGEISGAMRAMQYAIDKGYEKLTIYHDYQGISSWCQGKWQAKKPGTKAYKEFYERASKKLDISFMKVKGHTGDYYNDIADGLAKQELGIPVCKKISDKLASVHLGE